MQRLYNQGKLERRVVGSEIFQYKQIRNERWSTEIGLYYHANMTPASGALIKKQFLALECFLITYILSYLSRASVLLLWSTNMYCQSKQSNYGTVLNGFRTFPNLMWWSPCGMIIQLLRKILVSHRGFRVPTGKGNDILAEDDWAKSPSVPMINEWSSAYAEFGAR